MNDMTRLDYLAGQAMTTLLKSDSPGAPFHSLVKAVKEDHEMTHAEAVACLAVMYATAMEAELNDAQLYEPR